MENEPKKKEENKNEPKEKQEEQKAKETETKTTKENDPIGEAKKLVEDLQRVRDDIRKDMKAYERTVAANIIKGRSVAGGTEKKEESPQEYAKRIMEGEQ